MSKQLIDRQEQGRIIAKMNGSVNRLSDKSYIVSSHSGNGSYNVNANELGWNCSCPGHIYRGVKCKHIYAVELSFAIRKQVEIRKIEPVTNQCCIFCKSFNIVILILDNYYSIKWTCSSHSGRFCCFTGS